MNHGAGPEAAAVVAARGALVLYALGPSRSAEVKRPSPQSRPFSGGGHQLRAFLEKVGRAGRRVAGTGGG